MAAASTRRELEALKRLVASRVAALPTLTLGRLRADPCLPLRALGLCPDPFQERVATSTAPRLAICATRAAGKSTASACAALRMCLLGRALVLLLAPTARQAGELAVRAFSMYDALGQPVPATKRTELQLWLANGSRLVALPGNERNIRAYQGAALLVIDEAARVPDELYYSVRPMVAVSGGRIVCLSSPFGKRGFFHSLFTGDEPWERVRVTAHDVPRIPASFLAEEARALGPRWFRQEYLCSFEEVVGSLFRQEDIDAVADDTVPPLFAPALTPERTVPADLADERPPLFTGGAT